MRSTVGGFVTPQTSISLTFQNGVTTPPTNTNTFNVRTGSNPAPGAPFVVAAAGDGVGGEQSESDTTNLIASWNPNLFLYLGDVYEKGTSTEFYNWYRQQANPGNYGRFDSITDPTVGNHEYSGTRRDKLLRLLEQRAALLQLRRPRLAYINLIEQLCSSTRRSPAPRSTSGSPTI
jgi:hypothetical protein